MKNNNNTNDYYTSRQLKLPLEIEKMIDIADPVYSFCDIMDRIDLKKFLATEERRTGRPRCDEIKLLKVILFAFMENGISSLRDIEKLCKTDIRYMYLLDGMEAPSFVTFGNFIRNELTDSIEKSFDNYSCEMSNLSSDVQTSMDSIYQYSIGSDENISLLNQQYKVSSSDLKNSFYYLKKNYANLGLPLSDVFSHEELQAGYDADYYKGEGFVIPTTALAKGLQYYNLALRMYGNANTPGEWTDMLGLLMPTEALDQIKEDIMNGDIPSIDTLEERFSDVFDSYAQWKGFSDNDGDMEQAHEEWLSYIRRDAEKEYDMGDVSEEMVQEFINSLS